MKYSLFLLDADNTLYDYDAAEPEALKNVFSEYGLPFESEVHAAYKRINDALWKAREAGEIQLEEIKTRRFKDLLLLIGVEVGDVEAFANRYLANLANCSQLLDGAEDVCRELMRRGGKLVLFTNGIADVQRPRVKASPIADMFAALAISEELGVSKPDPRMVTAAMDMVSHTNKTTVLVVGDSQRADIGAAVAAGVDSCLIGRSAGSPVPTYEIGDIRKLPDIIR